MKLVKKTTKTTKTTRTKKKTKREVFKVKGEQLLKKVKDIIKQGNVRQITIKNKKGKTILILPLTIGVVGAVLSPVLAAVGAVAALVTECTVSVERNGK